MTRRGRLGKLRKGLADLGAAALVMARDTVARWVARTLQADGRCPACGTRVETLVIPNVGPACFGRREMGLIGDYCPRCNPLVFDAYRSALKRRDLGDNHA